MRPRLPRGAAALATPAFWGWLALASLPPDLLGSALGWGAMDPKGLGLSLLWWPVDVLGRLAALRLLLSAGGGAWAPWRGAYASALGAELLVTLKATLWALVGWLPGLGLASFLGDGRILRPGWVAALAVTLALGSLPALAYTLTRLLAPVEILRGSLGPGWALDASAARFRRDPWGLLRSALPWVALSWGVDLVSLALPDPVGWVLALPSAACGLLALAACEDA